MRNIIFAGQALMCAPVILSAPAEAAVRMPAVFDFSVGSNNNVANGNARIFSATSPDLGTFRVRATAWSLETVGSSTYVRDSKLMVYDGGLGVLSGDDGNGDRNRHTIDNSVRKDFILLQFDNPVSLISATFNTYGVMGSTKDSDAIIKFGWTNSPWNIGLDLNDKKVAILNALFDGSYTSLGSSSSGTRGINPDKHWGNVWLIGADWTNSDRKIDGFKLTNLAVVPEPSTWAMLIGGFGMAGVMARRRTVRVSA